ncbi:hypothetical protein [Nitrolancea hollandica]|uniref:Uncharacterized protein n=1 Tax=Nitrolancea hollandica Lb TaxID=1129897 RepID=I4ELT6_9BACT|nr:hypothetical protein [Nitrolancea hollandica]CCF85648.1 hypothetical protein NITHO_530006 [Nitrolancea hollandica Lb]
MYLVQRVALMRDGFTAPLDWNNDVIGMTTAGVNIEVRLTPSLGAGFTPPPSVQVAVTTRLPNHDFGIASLPNQLLLDVPVIGNEMIDGAYVYRVNRPVAQVFSGGTSPALTVATVVRDGGTSDTKFRAALSSAIPHGSGIQPLTNPQAPTGGKDIERPNARSLMLSGGVEVLNVTVIPNLLIQLPPVFSIPPPGNDYALVRSPATIFYYSGHGLSSDNCLAIERAGGGVTCWLGPNDIINAWRSLSRPKILIIAGCSLIDVHYMVGLEPPPPPPLTGPGLTWSSLLAKNGGALDAILGYRGSAPLDQSGGDQIAEEMARRINAGSTNYAKDWLEVNAARRAWNASALDGSAPHGRHWMIRHIPLIGGDNWSIDTLDL